MVGAARHAKHRARQRKARGDVTRHPWAAALYAVCAKLTATGS